MQSLKEQLREEKEMNDLLVEGGGQKTFTREMLPKAWTEIKLN